MEVSLAIKKVGEAGKETGLEDLVTKEKQSELIW